MPPSLRHTTARRVLGALVAAGLLTATTGAWTPATSAAPAPVVYVDWSDTRPLVGQRTLVAGVLGPAEEGQVVHLDRFLPDERRWVSAARQQASVDGHVGSFSFPLTHDTVGEARYRVRSAAGDTTVYSPTTDVLVSAQRRGLSARWSVGVADRGSTVTVRGRVARGGARTVLLQERAAGRWRTRSRTTSRVGRYRMPVPTSTYGTFTYRLVAPVTEGQRREGLSRAVSATKTFQVARRWEPGPIPEPQPDPVVAERPTSALGDPNDFTYITTRRARWNPCSTITYRVNTTNGPASALEDTQGAVARIEQATGLDLEYVGATKLVPQDSSAEGYPAGTQIVIAWAGAAQSPLITGESVAGVGGPMGWGGTVDEDGADILTWRRGTVVLNSAFNGVLDSGFGTGTTVGKLLMHEIGHVVGLGHAAGETQVMFPSLQREYPSDWGAGDLSGLRSQGADGGCIYEADGSVPSYRKGRVSVVSEVTADTLAEIG
jgi:hypothetical protein